ncbi:hypothetical protein [Bradyrhizobium sp. 150]|uniref:hypothetical protein n=1 Tax=Bradyrhizobium sp. 150 TaxID=2782625 RepID=UPI001FF831E5|nr:hypothetical protein [Bradyrhizobium sp. 150]MCK1676599.1 hypothetical protein [Bradyrhizobium sp. 150]
MKIIDNLMVVLPIAFIVIALLLAGALRVTRRRVRPCRLRAEAGDPFLYPFGEMPTVPRERHLVARDFRAWGIPLRSHSAAVAHRRNEGDGRPASLSGTAVVLTFPGRKT